MNKAENIFLTPNQLTFTLKSIMIGLEIMYIPNSIIPIAKQDSWICFILGAIYPLYMVIIANYMCSKFPGKNVLELSKKCFGSLLGTAFNLVFLSFFLFMVTSEVSGFSYIFRTYATTFMKNYQVYLAILIPIVYIAYKGINALGRLNEIGFYLTIILIFLPIGILSRGSLMNLMPVFGSGVTNIVRGSTKTTFSYAGMEILFLLYPFLQDKKELVKCGLRSTAIVTFIYTWAAFGTLFYLGFEIAPKYIWPLLTLSDSIYVPIINSFRYIFISLWAIVQFKCIATYYFVISLSLNQLITKVSTQTFTLILYPVIILICSVYTNPAKVVSYSNKLINIFILFNLVYISTIAVMIYIKKCEK